MFKDITCGFYIHKHFFDGETSPKRNVECFEIEIIKSGTGISFINGRQYPHLSGRIIIAKPDDERFTVGKCNCFFLKFNTDDLEVKERLQKLPVSTIVPDTSALENELEGFSSLLNNPEASRFKLYSNLFRVLDKICGAIDGTNTVLSDEHDRYLPLIIGVKDYIDKNFSERISLDHLSERFFLSKNFLRVKFKEIMGISPHEYLNKVRISNAKTMLRTSDSTVSDIAFACGFESQVYFNYSFKRSTNSTPSDYRRSV